MSKGHILLLLLVISQSIHGKQWQCRYKHIFNNPLFIAIPIKSIGYIIPSLSSIKTLAILLWTLDRHPCTWIYIMDWRHLYFLQKFTKTQILFNYNFFSLSIKLSKHDNFVHNLCKKKIILIRNIKHSQQSSHWQY